MKHRCQNFHLYTCHRNIFRNRFILCRNCFHNCSIQICKYNLSFTCYLECYRIHFSSIFNRLYIRIGIKLILIRSIRILIISTIQKSLIYNPLKSIQTMDRYISCKQRCCLRCRTCNYIIIYSRTIVGKCPSCTGLICSTDNPGFLNITRYITGNISTIITCGTHYQNTFIGSFHNLLFQHRG